MNFELRQRPMNVDRLRDSASTRSQRRLNFKGEGYNIIQGLKAISGAIGFNNLPKDQRQITFYSEGKSYWLHLENLLVATLERTDKSVCYLSSSLDDPGLMIKHPQLKTFFIGMGFVRDYVFQTIETPIMVMTMPDLNNFQVKRSRHNVHYVYVPHSLVSLHMIYRHGAFDHYDTICCAGPHHIQEIRAIEKKYNLPEKNLVALGYSRLDSLIEQAKKYPQSESENQCQHKKILIAPSWGSKGLIESGLGHRLVNELIALGHEVILRPHPQTIKFASNQVKKIVNLHEKNPHFTFESCVAGQESLHQSDIMVSDWSGAALEFAFALNRPVIFCDIPQKVNNPQYQDINLEPLEFSIRKTIGMIWDGQSPVAEIIELCEQKNKNVLHELSNQYVFNQGHADEVFTQFLGTV
ncbi:CDP-glycerol glycerophosphotransferase family protein [Candidatus Regiella endosymbiont of Tuberolachnus salignus]|uniref:CDP-glycerol glycerophosphotransferase family protein n=1 Tax=Candidatus Regiella endosymbiont of Tuberolachnus salignus TaxID=3077956 RepID=UPI0030D3CEE7